MNKKNELLKKRNELEKKLKGKLSKLTRRRAMKYINHIDYQLRQMKGLSAKAKRRQEMLENGQMHLPNFLSQMSTVRIEELVAEKLAKMIFSKSVKKAA